MKPASCAASPRNRAPRNPRRPHHPQRLLSGEQQPCCHPSFFAAARIVRRRGKECSQPFHELVTASERPVPKAAPARLLIQILRELPARGKRRPHSKSTIRHRLFPMAPSSPLAPMRASAGPYFPTLHNSCTNKIPLRASAGPNIDTLPHSLELLRQRRAHSPTSHSLPPTSTTSRPSFPRLQPGGNSPTQAAPHAQGTDASVPPRSTANPPRKRPRPSGSGRDHLPNLHTPPTLAVDSPTPFPRASARGKLPNTLPLPCPPLLPNQIPPRAARNIQSCGSAAARRR